MLAVKSEAGALGLLSVKVATVTPFAAWPSVALMAAGVPVRTSFSATVAVLVTVAAAVPAPSSLMVTVTE